MAREEKSPVDTLKDRLYSRTAKVEMTDVRTPLPHSESVAPVHWSDSPTPAPDTPQKIQQLLSVPEKSGRWSFAAKFLTASGVFFLIALGFALYTLFIGNNFISPGNIDIQVVAPSLVDGGKETMLQVLISNRNQSELQFADLVIEYPDGTRDAADESKILTHERQSLGTIASGAQLKRTASAIFYGQEGSQQKVIVTLEYSVPGSNAVFEKKSEVDIVVGSSPLSLTVDMPSETIAGQSFPFTITVQSNAAAALDDVVVQGQYPFGFSVVETDPTADAGGTLWRLGTIPAGGTKVIKLMGVIDGQDGDQRVFRFLAGSDNDPTNTQVKTPFLIVPQTLTVRRGFVTGSIAVNGEKGKTVSVSAGKTVQGTIEWQNNLQDPISDLEVTLSLDGQTLDKATVTSSNGFYQSSNSTLVWTKDENDSLATISPGETGTLQFSFATLGAGAGGVVYTNPTIALSLSIKGTRKGQGSVPEVVKKVASMQVTLASALSLTASASHYSGPFMNSGAMPPVVGKPTTYAILWTIKNSSNTVGGARVSAVLPPYVQFTGARSGDAITYDSASRTVTWNLGDVKANVGYSLAAREGYFQVSLLPSVSQVGESPRLTGEAKFVGSDRFTQTAVTASAVAPTIELIGDSGYQSTMGRVAE